ncbi:hypothetical protein M426DRAFT_321844 [Hypoxylon sp. CI-4A]|nr:hypothetical protein M426DRAFT_321844 [Hypoxylon sp. CI-4A]
MVSNENSLPATETRGDHEISPVSDPVSTNNANTSASTRNQPGETTPPLPFRAAANPATQPPPARHQQSQLPYNPYQYQQPYAYPQPIRMVPQYSKPWTASKLVLTILLITFDIIIIALACSLISEGSYDGEGMSLYSLPIAIVSLLWNAAELITYACRSRSSDVKRGIHPGAHVGLHLCFWIVGVFAVFLSVIVDISVQSAILECAEDEDDDHYFYSSNYCDEYRSSFYANGAYISIVRAITAFFCLFTLTHFVLFVLACIDTHRRNMLKPAGLVVPPMAPKGGMYYPPPQAPGVAPYYPYGVPAPPQQAYFTVAPGAAAPNAPQANPAAQQNYQAFAGFYAPAPQQSPRSPSQSIPSPTDEKSIRFVPTQPPRV